MKLIIIDRKAWERHRSEFADFIHRVEKLIGNPPKTEQWLDNESVCKRLGISKRTWKSHTNLTHPGKYFRPSKVKIMRPTSPK